MNLGWLRQRSAWRRVLELAVVAHIAFGVLRLPHAAWGKRLDQMRALEQRGAIDFHLESYGSLTVETVRELSLLPEDSVVLWRGDHRGPIELVPALLRPRLLYAEAAVPPGATHVLGRPLARQRSGAGERCIVLVAEGRNLRLEAR
jgi:hypothetical protein